MKNACRAVCAVTVLAVLVAATAAWAKGTASVLFAGSLVALMEHDLVPAFERADGFAVRGFGGGSSELASEIKSRVRSGDVFVSASAKADQALAGSSNGNWVSWYAAFMATPLELAYNPSTSFGRELHRGVPWYRVLTQPGIRVGRTDPVLDPKGVLTSEAVGTAARKLHDPALAKALGSFAVYPETSLVGRMQSGQLDAGFFNAVEAETAKLSTVPLTPVYKYAAYTVTILNHASDAAGAAAFVRYLVTSARSFTLARNGINPMTPQFSGRAGAVPAGLRALVGAH